MTLPLNHAEELRRLIVSQLEQQGTQMTDPREQAFLKFLKSTDFPEATTDDIGGEGQEFLAFGREFRVLTDEEACEATGQAVRDSLWAFKPEFIADACGLPDAFAEVIRPAQEELCEGLNETLERIIDEMCRDQADLGGEPGMYGPGGLGTFAYLAAQADGRGHFLSGYDGEEHEITTDGDDQEPVTFYVYRTN